MTAPLISDATMSTIVRAAHDPSSKLTWHEAGEIAYLVAHDRLAYALDQAKYRDPSNANLIEALEEANEEAARTYNEREAAALPAPRGTLTMVVHDSAGRRHETTIQPSGSVSTTVTDPPVQDPTRGKVTLTAKHSTPWSDGAEMRRGDALAAAARAVAPSTTSGVYEEADALLDDMSESEVDAELRSMGIDPIALGERGAAFVAGLSPPLTVGPFKITANDAGAHVRVVVRGDGAEGSRPLLGELVMSPAEWSAFRALVSR